MSIDIIIDIELYILFVTYINMGYWTIWDIIWHSKSYEFSVLKIYLQFRSIFDFMEIFVEKHHLENFIAIAWVVFEIFMKNPMSHMIEFWIKPISRDKLWRHGVNTAIWETRKSNENCSVFFLHGIIDIWSFLFFVV